MHISRYEIVPEAELLSRLKKTRLKGYGGVEVYRQATLEIARFHPDLLWPAQRYVLRDGVETILDLARSFAEKGIDVFSLRGALRFWTGDGGEPIPFLPPVVEESREPGGHTVLLINDGIHRVWAARKLGREINVVVARNVPPEYPYYAYALAKGWQEVEELAALKEGYQKKTYRDPENYKALFRDFNGVFEGVQKQRPRTNPPHLKANA